jgi:hypothetical protein
MTGWPAHNYFIHLQVRKSGLRAHTVEKIQKDTRTPPETSVIATSTYCLSWIWIVETLLRQHSQLV